MVVATCAAGPAWGQLNALPNEVIVALNLNPEQEAQIGEYVKAHSTKLTDKDAEEIKKDRTALINPIVQNNPSTAFRISYSAKVLPVVTDLVKNPREEVAISALVVVGELATDRAANVIKGEFGAKSPAVRAQAAYAARRTYQAQQTAASVTISAQASLDLAAALEAAIQKEGDALVADAFVRAAFEASLIAKADAAGLRSRALQAVSRGLSGRAGVMGDAALDGKQVQTLMRACTELRNQLAGANNVPPLRGADLDEAVTYAGHVIAHVGRVTKKGIGTEDRAAYADLANAAEMVVVTAAPVKDKAIQQKKIGDALKQGNPQGDALTVNNVRDFVGANGMLEKAPWNLKGFKAPN